MADLLRISLLGAMPDGEEWSINPVWSIEPPGLDIDFTEATAIATAVAAVALPVGVQQIMSTSTSWTGVRVEARTLAGELEAVAQVNRASAAAGSSSSAHPYQTSLVLSLRTAHPGARGRGRLYLPATGAPIGVTNLRMTATNRDAALAGLKTWMSGIQTAVQVTVPLSTLHVWSRTNSALYQVNRLQVGDILDVQRRRRDALVENYGLATYP
jgi:hypothetical protein